MKDEPFDPRSAVAKLRRTARAAENNAHWAYLAAGAFHPDGLHRSRHDPGDKESIGAAYVGPLAGAARALADLIERSGRNLDLLAYKQVLSDVAAQAGLDGRARIAAEDVLTVLTSDNPDRRRKALRLLPFCVDAHSRDPQNVDEDRPASRRSTAGPSIVR